MSKEIRDFLEEFNNCSEQYGVVGEFPHVMIEFNERYFKLELKNRSKVSPIVKSLFVLLEDKRVTQRHKAMIMLRKLIHERRGFLGLQVLVEKYFEWKKENTYYKKDENRYYGKSPIDLDMF